MSHTVGQLRDTLKRLTDLNPESTQFTFKVFVEDTHSQLGRYMGTTTLMPDSLEGIKLFSIEDMGSMENERPKDVAEPKRPDRIPRIKYRFYIETTNLNIQFENHDGRLELTTPVLTTDLLNRIANTHPDNPKLGSDGKLIRGINSEIDVKLYHDLVAHFKKKDDTVREAILDQLKDQSLETTTYSRYGDKMFLVPTDLGMISRGAKRLYQSVTSTPGKIIGTARTFSNFLSSNLTPKTVGGKSNRRRKRVKRKTSKRSKKSRGRK